jgi:hypothetical protein
LAHPAISLDPLQHDLRNPVRVEFDVVDRDDVGVLEQAGHPRLAYEFPDRTVGDDLRPQRLDRDLAPEPKLRRAEHEPHAALAQSIVDRECGPAELGQSFWWRSHRNGSARGVDGRTGMALKLNAIDACRLELGGDGRLEGGRGLV